MSHLIIVPCHSIWNQFASDTKNENLGHLPEQWFLAPFQLEGNDHIAFIKHGLQAIRSLAKDPSNKSVVIFSGSQTKTPAGCISEAQSYYFLMWRLLERVYHNAECFPAEFPQEIVQYLTDIKSILLLRAISLQELFTSLIATEEFALDSFENLLFSLYRFKEFIGEFPDQVTIVGFGFKERRFIEYHAKSIDFPADKIRYVAIDPQPKDYDSKKLQAYFDELRSLEQQNALELFASDWYGTRRALRVKKKIRNPFKRINTYHEVRLFDLNGTIHDDDEFFETYIKGKMPWSVNV